MYKHAHLVAALCLLFGSLASASSGDMNPPAAPDSATADSKGTALDDSSAKPNEGPLSRWLDVDALSFSMRYRSSFDTDGVRVFDNIQQRSLVSGKLKLDRQGKYFIGFRATSGRYFNWSYASFSGLDYSQAVNRTTAHVTPQHSYQVYRAFAADPQAATIVGAITARGWEFYVRDLYLSATPVSWLTAEFGAIPIARGVGTEITTFDDDGYISGERVSVHAPKQLYLDKVSFTSAYLGDVTLPNFFDRYDRLTQSNYRQVLAEKHFGSRLKASMDYTWLAKTNTLHEAVLVKTSETRVLDSARVELYQRTNDVLMPGYLAKAGNGWAFTGSKGFHKRITVEGGYATIDQDNGVYTDSSLLAAVGFSMNGDSYQVGKRFFGRANVHLVNGISLFGFYTHQIDSKATPLTYSFTRQNLNFGAQFDFKSMLKQAHVL